MPIINSHLATVRVWDRTNLRSARHGIPEKLTGTGSYRAVGTDSRGASIFYLVTSNN